MHNKILYIALDRQSFWLKVLDVIIICLGEYCRLGEQHHQHRRRESKSGAKSERFFFVVGYISEQNDLPFHKCEHDKMMYCKRRAKISVWNSVCKAKYDCNMLMIVICNQILYFF